MNRYAKASILKMDSKGFEPLTPVCKTSVFPIRLAARI